MTDHIPRFKELCIHHTATFVTKNKQYGNAFEVYGLLGVVCELLGAVARLPQLVLWSPGHGKGKEDDLRDILMDIHNFANMGLLVLEKKNYDGRPEGEA